MPRKQRNAPPDPEHRDRTRERLLRAGGEVFADDGFRAATVRRICAKADANVSAVKYHFGDKAGLYTAVLEHSLSASLEKYPPDLGVLPHDSPRKRLHAFVRSFLLRMLAEDRCALYGRLMAREIAEPTTAFDRICPVIIRPQFERLISVLRELAPGAGDRMLRQSVMSVIGQCLHHFHAGPIIRRLTPEQTYGAEDIEQLADHITRFSLGGLIGLSTAGAAESRHDLRKKTYKSVSRDT